MLIAILSSIFGCVILLLLLAGAFSMIFSSPSAEKLFKKAFVAVIVYAVSLFLLQQLTAHLSLLWLPCLLVASPLAYTILMKRRSAGHRQREPLRGAERSPVLPSGKETTGEKQESV